ncbi:MAG: DUF2383 domain-containing protein [Firmicutes bacterium]|nr:DUF2383 domain-containing protein [Bacillota bacterium]
MAVDTFNIFISKLNDQKMKQKLQRVQKEHRKNISTLAEFIQNQGGEPKENLGLKGTMADFKLNRELNSKDNNYIINKVIEGETQGINMAEKVLRGRLDHSSRKIAEEILDQDRKSLNEIKSLIN